MIHLDIIISGRVQGVGFRYSALNQAKALGIKGFVKNMHDGSVYMEIEGDKLATDLMVEWCRMGPGTGSVSKIHITESQAKEFKDFTLKY
jgi:acylphosphatase